MVLSIPTQCIENWFISWLERIIYVKLEIKKLSKIPFIMSPLLFSLKSKNFEMGLFDLGLNIGMGRVVGPFLQIQK